MCFSPEDPFKVIYRSFHNYITFQFVDPENLFYDLLSDVAPEYLALLLFVLQLSTYHTICLSAKPFSVLTLPICPPSPQQLLCTEFLSCQPIHLLPEHQVEIPDV